jgi:hypothetical protein
MFCDYEPQRRAPPKAAFFVDFVDTQQERSELPIKMNPDDESPSISSISSDSTIERLSAIKVSKSRNSSLRSEGSVQTPKELCAVPSPIRSNVHSDSEPIKFRPVPLNAKFVESLHGFEIPSSAGGSRSAPSGSVFVYGAQPNVLGLGQSSYANYYQNQQLRYNSSNARSRVPSGRSIYSRGKEEESRAESSPNTLLGMLHELNESPSSS